MCAIAGIYNLDGKPVENGLLQRMAEVMKHRGPDDEGHYLNRNIGFAHRRLSIIDLSSVGHQPMSNEEKTIWIIHNGEVYNYLEIREDLRKKGYRFRSNTDTEVILYSYQEYGVKCLQRFNGMWAFAIWDERERKLFCARDRFGIKPFYYFFDGKKFVFASEIKGILEDKNIPKEPNEQIIYNYLAAGYLDHTEETFFSGIKQLPSAHYLIIKNDNLEIRRYWELNKNIGRDESRPYNKQSPLCHYISKASFATTSAKQALPLHSYKKTEEYAERFRELFIDSVRLRLRADVPVGTCLSGGLDSSSIVCVANNLLHQGFGPSLGNRQQSFSAVYKEEKYDERKFIEEVVEKTNIQSHYTFPKGEDLLEDLDKLIWHQEEPFCSTSIYAQWQVFKIARENNVKVMLDGQGGDETLAGYHSYYLYYLADLLKSFRPISFLQTLISHCRNHSLSFLPALAHAIGFTFPDSVKLKVKKITRKETAGLNWLNEDFTQRYQYPSLPIKYKTHLENILYQALFYNGLPSLLHYEDRNSMAFSIEARVPFLDYRLVEFLFSLPISQKIHYGTTKVVLRNSMEGILPEKTRNRRDKIGFATPEENWFRTSLKKPIEEIIHSKSFQKRPYFNVEFIKKAFATHCKDKKNISQTIWRWVNLELWMRKFIE